MKNKKEEFNIGDWFILKEESFKRLKNTCLAKIIPVKEPVPVKIIGIKYEISEIEGTKKLYELNIFKDPLPYNVSLMIDPYFTQEEIERGYRPLTESEEKAMIIKNIFHKAK